MKSTSSTECHLSRTAGLWSTSARATAASSLRRPEPVGMAQLANLKASSNTGEGAKPLLVSCVSQATVAQSILLARARALLKNWITSSTISELARHDTRFP